MGGKKKTSVSGRSRQRKFNGGLSIQGKTPTSSRENVHTARDRVKDGNPPKETKHGSWNKTGY